MDNLDYKALMPLSANNCDNKNNKAIESPICTKELEKYLSNFKEYMMTLSVYDMSSLLIAEQDWLKRYNVNRSISESLVGKILKVDFGKTYLLENGLIHYAVCISEFNGKYCVVPMTTASDEIKAAYHPEYRPTGEKRLYLLKRSDGNTQDAALYINDLKFISSGRIITVCNKINPIAYNNIIRVSCEVSNNDIYLQLVKKEYEIEKLEDQVKMMNDKICDLEKKYSLLEKNNELLLNMLNKY